MITSSAHEWKPGDKGLTKEGAIVTISEVVGGRYLKIAERHIEKQVYIPSHGEIEKLS